MMKKENKFFKYLSLFPISFYVIVLILLPLIYIFFFCFLTSDYYGGIIYSLTLSIYLNLVDLVYI